MQSIIEGKIEFPEGFKPSESCMALLSRMLEGNPKKRATVEEIQGHPWYQKDLPRGVMTMNDTMGKAAFSQVGLATNFGQYRVTAFSR